MTPVSPHDALFRDTFSDPGRAFDELRAVFSDAIARHVEPASLLLVEGSLVDESLKARHSDLLFRLRLRGHSAFAFFLFEHQSAADPLMPFRMLRYMLRIWDDGLASHPGASRLPVILPLVMSHHPGGWSTHRALAALFDASPDQLADFAPWLPSLSLAIDDLSGIPDDDLRARATDVMAKLVLVLLKHARGPTELEALVDACGSLFREVRSSPSGHAAFARALRYLFSATRRPPEEVARLIGGAMRPEEREEVMEEALSTADRLIRQGLLQGREEGLQKGLQRGRQEALRSTLLRQAARRFGDVPATISKRIGQAGLAQLEAWSERLIVAGSLEEAFAGE